MPTSKRVLIDNVYVDDGILIESVTEQKQKRIDVLLCNRELDASDDRDVPVVGALLVLTIREFIITELH